MLEIKNSYVWKYGQVRIYRGENYLACKIRGRAIFDSCRGYSMFVFVFAAASRRGENQGGNIVLDRTPCHCRELHLQGHEIRRQNGAPKHQIRSSANKGNGIGAESDIRRSVNTRSLKTDTLAISDNRSMMRRRVHLSSRTANRTRSVWRTSTLATF